MPRFNPILSEVSSINASKQSRKYCKNCNSLSHTNARCMYPITSIGIILVDGITYNMTDDISSINVLLVRRKDTFGYVDFLRGKPNFNNESEMSDIINEMTISEKNEIASITKIDDVKLLRYKMWGNRKVVFRKEEHDACYKIMLYIKTLAASGMTLVDVINKSNTNWIEAEWGFPKGKREYMESDVKCAFREFEEETGINRSRITIFQNIHPTEEIYVGTDNRPYKHKYFIGQLVRGSPPVELGLYQKSEIGDMKWMRLEEAIRKIRPANVEKIRVLSNMQDILKKYRVIV